MVDLETAFSNNIFVTTASTPASTHIVLHTILCGVAPRVPHLRSWGGRVSLAFSTRRPSLCSTAPAPPHLPGGCFFPRGLLLGSRLDFAERRPCGGPPAQPSARSAASTHQAAAPQFAVAASAVAVPTIKSRSHRITRSRLRSDHVHRILQATVLIMALGFDECLIGGSRHLAVQLLSGAP